jgi:NADP-dependent alcohol dehydrogenase
MYNFIYQNPTKILFGKGQIAQLSKQIPLGTKIMLTYGGGSIMQNGVYEQVKLALTGYEIIEFGGIEANPTIETLMKAVKLGKKEKIKYLLSVGGGSVLDGTKFIALALNYKGKDQWIDIVMGKNKPSKATPIGAVLTLPATGSEMNPFAVISSSKTKLKQGMSDPKVFPVFSILDPETTFSLPQKQVANGIADAFTHTMEQYLTFPASADLQDRMCESVIQTLIQCAPKTLANPTDYDSRADFMWAATMALNGMISVGVPQDWATHQIGHELTALHGIDHARTLAVVMPHLHKLKQDEKKEKLIQYAQRVWKLTGTDQELIDGAIAKTTEFYESLGIPTKASYYKIGAKTIKTIMTRFEAKKAAFGERKNITADVVKEILELSIGK